MKHSWVWQLAFPFASRTQVCLRAGCDWRRRRVELPGLRRPRRWAYAVRAGSAYRLLLRVPPCSGSSVQSWKALRGSRRLPPPVV